MVNSSSSDACDLQNFTRMFLLQSRIEAHSCIMCMCMVGANGFVVVSAITRDRVALTRGYFEA